jgi:thymidylate synthase
MTYLRTFEGNNIDKLHYEITKTIIEKGEDIVFGYEHKKAREIFAVVKLHGHAIKRLQNGSVPKKFMWSGKKVKEFCKMSVADNPNPYGHDYTYQELLRDMHIGQDRYNQINMLKERINEIDYIDNGLVAVLYQPEFFYMDNKPCCQWIQIRRRNNGTYSFRILFRSHDYGCAYWANLAFFLYMMKQYIDIPISEVILVSTSAHIYENDSDWAQNIAKTPWTKFKIRSIIGL